MSIQNGYCIIFLIMAALQVICAIVAFKSDKLISNYAGRLNLALAVPLIANVMIIKSGDAGLSSFSYYLSYIGMDLVMVSLINYTNSYCKGVDERRTVIIPYPCYALLIGDMIQILLGPVFHHVMTIETTILDGSDFYRDVTHIGLTVHRIVDYVIFACIIITYVISMIKTSKLYREKYSIILYSLILAGAVQLAFISSRIPIDRSLLVHGAFGVVVFYFSLFHRPLRVMDTLLSNVVSDMNDAVFVFDNANKCVWVNNQGFTMLGLEGGSTRAASEALFEKFKNIKNKGENWIENRIIDNQYFILEKTSVKTDKKYLDGSFLVIKDDTERHNAIEAEIYNSTHDSLTGLYNMSYLYSKIKNELVSSDKKYYAIIINFKNIKLINENFGRAFGDVVLIRMSDWLKTNIKSGVYGRLVGDTFGICMPQDDFDEDFFLKELGNFIIRFKNMEHRSNIHIGVYDIKDKNIDVSVMFDRAHLAIVEIEENYKTVIKYYNEHLKKELLEEQRLVDDFPGALDSNQIVPYLQPIANKDGKIVGAEALARWIHSDLGFLPPDKFIPVFEKNGMITDLDEHIWRQVCKILADWKTTNPDLFISINISPKDFFFTDVVSDIKEMVKEYDIDPYKLRIEITETAMMTDSEDRIRILNDIRSAGFIVEMDDFGSGYSSLNMLKDMPVDVLKLDMKFLSEENNDKSEKIIKNIINLANELDIIPLTEGVETEGQFNQLASMGCALFQGYHFAKPMLVKEFEEYLV